MVVRRPVALMYFVIAKSSTTTRQLTNFQIEPGENLILHIVFHNKSCESTSKDTHCFYSVYFILRSSLSLLFPTATFTLKVENIDCISFDNIYSNCLRDIVISHISVCSCIYQVLSVDKQVYDTGWPGFSLRL